MVGYKATDACLIRATLTGIRTSQNIPLSLVTDICLLFLKDARATTCFENPCYQNMQITTYGHLLFEANDEFEDALTTIRNTTTQRLSPHTDLTSFLITVQCERNSNGALTFDGLDTQNQNISVELRGAPIFQGATDSYYNVDTSGKRPPPPILCTVHDTFWLFSPDVGRSCLFDTNDSFDEVVGSLRF
ncbi:MAG: hypothetical protein EZS28_007520 [Streblomastix strix]|uniref:Uncharacterized protein n=1 Tax=Streblomastix strix TaxID=222440 RepID=A0A5J4WQV2_9EUKA|nr:MAG: hypothetical protein EZS28_007520 [Streblomastix strix]